MRMTMHPVLAGLATVVLLLAASGAWANNLQVTNVTVLGRDANTAYVQFDLSWQNSWRYTNVNHDAAWVFFKVQPQGTNAWQPATLQGSGTNPLDYSTGIGTGVELVVPSDRMGLFVRRSAEGSGPVSVQNVKAVWNFATNGLAKTNNVLMQALAVEMVYVPDGAFWAGNTNGIINSSFHAQGNENSPVYISSTNASTLYYGTGDGNHTTLPAAFPNGFAGFYCMKYEITQGQYCDFLNTLTFTQATNRWSSSSTGSRYTIGTNTVGVFTNSAPDRACNYQSVPDGFAFADWAGLRPMTELEYEKACRGPVPPVQNEYAWGTVNISNTTAIANDGTGIDTQTGGNAIYNWGIPYGPARVGMYATGNSSREAAGASYWGIMELSGNLHEVTVSTIWGTGFTGLHGDGKLSVGGNADVVNWPGITAYGSGFRGGEYDSSVTDLRVSDRRLANAYDASRYSMFGGGRYVRTAPVGLGP